MSALHLAVALALAAPADTVPAVANDSIVPIFRAAATVREWDAATPRALCVTRYAEQGGIVVVIEMQDATPPGPNETPAMFCGGRPLWLMEPTCELHRIDAAFALDGRAFVAKQCGEHAAVLFRRTPRAA